MPFRDYIDLACEHLKTLGIEPIISEGEPISASAFLEAETEMGFPLPSELRRYLDELGDGFQLSYSAEPVTGNEDDQFWWQIDLLNDILMEREGMRQDLVCNLNGADDRRQTQACLEEIRKRLHWVPVFGTGGGGYTFCVDGGEGGGGIRYHDIEMSDSEMGSVHLAGSIEDWMAKWSRFCFSQPLWNGTSNHGHLVSYSYNLVGTFDWSPHRFRREFHRPQIG